MVMELALRRLYDLFLPNPKSSIYFSEHILEVPQRRFITVYVLGCDNQIEGNALQGPGIRKGKGVAIDVGKNDEFVSLT